MRFVLSFFLIVFFSSEVISQNPSEKIIWRQNHRLSWSDFKAAPKPRMPYSANTNSGFSFGWGYSDNSGLTYKIKANFYPYKSWVKPEAKSPYLLRHEQLHFDISELYARKLRKALDDYIPGRNMKKELDRIYNQIEKERQQLQQRFDRETSHSQNKEAEEFWQQFIKEELRKLTKFSS
jgi:hypothetical protein